MEVMEEKAEGQPETIERTVSLDELDATIKEMAMSLDPRKRLSAEAKALQERTIDPPFEEAAKVLEPYRNRYAGQRCFIIGNGPSLRPEDLDRIKDEFSIGCNYIYRLFDKTSWRPRVYTALDECVFRDTFDEVSDLDIELKLCAIRGGAKMYPVKDCWPINLIGQVGWILDREMPPFSDDITKCVHHGITISYVNMQIAAFLGFKEVVLTGFDHQFPQYWKISPEVLKNKEKYRNSETLYGSAYKVRGVERAEFHESDFSLAAYCIEEVEMAYRRARLYFEEHGGRIVNATRGGKLDIFERVNFDKLMQPKKVQVVVPPKQATAKQSWMKKSGIKKAGRK